MGQSSAIPWDVLGTILWGTSKAPRAGSSPWPRWETAFFSTNAKGGWLLRSNMKIWLIRSKIYQVHIIDGLHMFAHVCTYVQVSFLRFPFHGWGTPSAGRNTPMVIRSQFWRPTKSKSLGGTATMGTWWFPNGWDGWGYLKNGWFIMVGIEMDDLELPPHFRKPPHTRTAV